MLLLGLLATLLVVWLVWIGIDFLDGRFVSVLFLIGPPMLLAFGGHLWRMSGWKEWLLRIDERGIAFRTVTGFGRLAPPRSIAWPDFARAEFATGPKMAQTLELRDTKGTVRKVPMPQIKVGFAQIIERLEKALTQAGVPFKRTGWDVILFDKVVIERDDTP